MESGDKYKSVTTVELHHDQSTSNAVKVRIPIKEYPSVSIVFPLATFTMAPRHALFLQRHALFLNLHSVPYILVKTLSKSDQK